MKKILIFGLISALMLVSLNGCLNEKADPAKKDPTKKTELTETEVEKIKKDDKDITKISKTVINLLKNKDIEALASYVHPNNGLRLSPYAYVDVENDIVIMADDLVNEFSNGETRLWGLYDGSGFPIKYTFAEYYDEFIYNHDYAKPHMFSVNKSIIAGSMETNIETVYDQPGYMEFHFPGFDPQYEGMDWESLFLVFEHYEGEWKLSGIVHDQWTT